MRAPLNKMEVSSQYGWRIHPLTNVKAFHNGIDLKAKLNTPIYAPFAGVVERSIHKTGGKQLVLRHSGGLRCGFAHLSGYNDLYPNGSQVPQGAIIAYTGQSGQVTGPHLHFTTSVVDRGGDRVTFDPLIIEWDAPLSILS